MFWYGIWGGWECLGCDGGDADHQCKCSLNCSPDVLAVQVQCSPDVLTMHVQCSQMFFADWPEECTPCNVHHFLAIFLRISWIVHPMFLQSLSEFLAMCQNLFTQCSWNVPPRFSQRPQFKLLLRICNVENSLKTIQHHSQLYISACMWQGDSKWKS